VEESVEGGVEESVGGGGVEESAGGGLTCSVALAVGSAGTGSSEQSCLVGHFSRYLDDWHAREGWLEETSRQMPCCLTHLQLVSASTADNRGEVIIGTAAFVDEL